MYVARNTSRLTLWNAEKRLHTTRMVEGEAAATSCAMVNYTNLRERRSTFPIFPATPDRCFLPHFVSRSLLSRAHARTHARTDARTIPLRKPRRPQATWREWHCERILQQQLQPAPTAVEMPSAIVPISEILEECDDLQLRPRTATGVRELVYPAVRISSRGGDAWTWRLSAACGELERSSRRGGWP